MRAFVATVVVLAVAPAAATAAPRWFPEQQISPFGWGIAEADIDPAGNAVALLSSSGGLATTSRPAAGRFSDPVGLPFVTGAEPQMGIDDQGGTVVAWRSSAPNRIQATTRAAGGGFTAPVDISTPDDFPSNLWELEAGSNGTAAVAWRSGAGYTVRVKPPGGSFGPPEPLTPTNDVYMDPPQVEIDGTGRVFVFFASPDGYLADVEYAEKPPGGSFGTMKVAVSRAGPAPGVVDVSPSGALAVLWSRLPEDAEGTNDFESALAVRPVGAAEFEAPQPFAAGGDPSLVVDNDTEATVVSQMHVSYGRTSRIEAKTRGEDGTMNPPQTVSGTSGYAYQPRVGVDATGAAVVIWQQTAALTGPFPIPMGNEPTRVEASARPPGGSFGAPGALSGNSVRSSSALAVSAGGTGLAIWTEEVSGRSCVKAVVRAETSLPGDGRTCASIPQPNVPGVVIDPFSGAPVLSFAGSKTLRLSSPVIGIKASCNEACVLSASGKVTVTGASRVLRLKGARTKLLPARKKVTLKLRLSKRSYRSLRRALKRGARAKAVLKVTARDPGGAKRTFKRTLRLRSKR